MPRDADVLAIRDDWSSGRVIADGLTVAVPQFNPASGHMVVVQGDLQRAVVEQGALDILDAIHAVDAVDGVVGDRDPAVPIKVGGSPGQRVMAFDRVVGKAA